MDREWSGRRIAGGVTLATAVATVALMAGGLSSPGTTGSVADYLTVRNAVLTAAPVTAMALRSWSSLRVLLGVWTVVQAGDAAVGVAEGSVPKAVGPAVFGFALLIAAWGLRRRPR